MTAAKFVRTLYLLMFLSFTSYAISQTFVAPFSELADPNIVHQGDWYYYMGTGGNGIKMRRAKTLEGLKTEPLKMVFSPADGGPCCAYWAPELHRLNNTWYIYYTANTTGSINDQRMWVIENTSENPMEGTWVNRGRIYDPANDYWAIDPTIFELNGQLFIVYSGVAAPQDGDKPQRLYIAHMSTPWTMSGNRMLLSSPEFAFETDGLVNEGPAVLRHNGKTFLTYSGSGCWTPNYAIGMLWMDDNEDPMNPWSWEKLNYPVFSKDSSNDMYGPGHHSFFNSPDGSEVWMTYHATPVAAGACDGTRVAHAKRIDFDNNGFPVFGTPDRAGTAIQAPSGETAKPFNTALLNGIYKISPSSTTDKTLDVAACSPLAGANVQQWQSNGGDCQKWHVQATADGHFWIGSVKGGLPLDVKDCSTENAANVGTWNPNGSNCQKWDILPNDNGTFRVINIAADKALDIQFGGNDNGANLQTYSYLGNDQQNFRFELLDAGVLIEPGTYEIVSRKSNMAMDLANCNQAEAANIIQYNRLNNDCQKWNIEEAGQGYYRIIAQASGKALSVANCSVELGSNIEQSSANTDCQKFAIIQTKDNWFTIVSKINGLALDVAGCSTNANANIALWNNWQGDCQQWEFVAASNSGGAFEYFREAENTYSQSAVESEVTTDPLGGNLNLGYIDAGDWMAYDNVTIPTSGNYLVEYRIATPNDGRTLSLDLNAGETQLGVVTLPNTGGWQNWQTISHTVTINAGTYSLGIYTPDGGWNINWFRISAL